MRQTRLPMISVALMVLLLVPTNAISAVVTPLAQATAIAPSLWEAEVPAPTPDHTDGNAVLLSAPLMCVENISRFDEDVRSQAHDSARCVWLTENAPWLTVYQQEREETEQLRRDTGTRPGLPTSQPRRGVSFRLASLGASRCRRLEPCSRLCIHVSYYLGNDRNNWQTDVPV